MQNKRLNKLAGILNMFKGLEVSDTDKRLKDKSIKYSKSVKDKDILVNHIQKPIEDSCTPQAYLNNCYEMMDVSRRSNRLTEAISTVSRSTIVNGHHSLSNKKIQSSDNTSSDVSMTKQTSNDIKYNRKDNDKFKYTRDNMIHDSNIKYKEKINNSSYKLNSLIKKRKDSVSPTKMSISSNTHTNSPSVTKQKERDTPSYSSFFKHKLSIVKMDTRLAPLRIDTVSYLLKKNKTKALSKLNPSSIDNEVVYDNSLKGDKDDEKPDQKMNGANGNREEGYVIYEVSAEDSKYSQIKVTDRRSSQKRSELDFVPTFKSSGNSDKMMPENLISETEYEKINRDGKLKKLNSLHVGNNTEQVETIKHTISINNRMEKNKSIDKIKKRDSMLHVSRDNSTLNLGHVLAHSDHSKKNTIGAKRGQTEVEVDDKSLRREDRKGNEYKDNLLFIQVDSSSSSDDREDNILDNPSFNQKIKDVFGGDEYLFNQKQPSLSNSRKNYEQTMNPKRHNNTSLADSRQSNRQQYEDFSYKSKDHSEAYINDTSYERFE